MFVQALYIYYNYCEVPKFFDYALSSFLIFYMYIFWYHGQLSEIFWTTSTSASITIL